MLMIILVSTSNVHAEEWEALVKVQTEELVTERFNADYGAADFWEELVDANGPFRFWTVEQKNWYSGLLPHLLEAEEQRIYFGYFHQRIKIHGCPPIFSRNSY